MKHAHLLVLHCNRFASKHSKKTDLSIAIDVADSMQKIASFNINFRVTALVLIIIEFPISI